MSLITVIIPVYKVKKEYLDCCIESIYKQDVNDIEIILVNDGSPDDSGIYCDEYAEKDDRIKVIHKDNGGSASARNVGIKNATGKWIMFIDADDWIENDLFQDFVALSPTDDVDIVIFPGYTEYINKTIPDPVVFEDKRIFATREEIDEIAIKTLSKAANIPNTASLTSVWGKFYRREFLHKNNLLLDEQMRYNEDVIFCLETYEKASKIIFLGKNYYHYREVSSSKTNKYRKNVEKEQELVLKRIKGFIETNKKGKGLLHAYYLRALISIQMCFFQKYYHPEYSDGHRRKTFIDFLSSSPYKETLDEISVEELKKSFKVKYLCFKKHLFFVLLIVQKVYKYKQKLEPYR
ncbi:glycosyltransferase family 2 protein [Aristaeella lactis]|uniref:Glycosyl transferase family 2 n=1 Tax=Aristaeella lactis TaxID=3046383 RepID=A0AC61PJE8_9FIRM|nr:glycosyltransferase family A protein [Aristaeella lactis]QUA54044.1 glycosyltransferase family 2 protein [Aristaeella lactis]SMC42701.1 Glycosyl transferase family 2 [Aristaeella lactis]